MASTTDSNHAGTPTPLTTEAGLAGQWRRLAEERLVGLERLAHTIMEMADEYDRDEACDYVKINGFIELLDDQIHEILSIPYATYADRLDNLKAHLATLSSGSLSQPMPKVTSVETREAK